MPGTSYTKTTAQRFIKRSPTQHITERIDSRSDIATDTAEKASMGDIYFSPLDLNCSKIELSSTLPSPTLTITQESHNAAASAAGLKLRLEPGQVDRLVTALVNAPIVQDRFRTQATSPKQSPRFEQPSFLSLRTALKDVQPKDSAVSIKSPSSAVLQESFARLQIRPALRSPSTPGVSSLQRPLQVKLSGIAMLEPEINGAPIRLWSRNYRNNSNVLRVGKRRFLNIPHGTYPECAIRVEPPSPTSTKPHAKVLMQVISHVLERRTGKKTYFLVTELDVTESFRKAALTELAEQSHMDLDDIEVKSTSNCATEDTSSVDVDWCEIADDLQSTSDANDLVESASNIFAHLQMDDCTTQTRALVSELDNIRRKHQDFLIVQSHGEHENGTPTSMSVPYISQHLDNVSNVDTTMSADSTREFREQLIGIVAKRATRSGPFADNLQLGGSNKTAQCLPLVECTGEKNFAWVCFLRDA